MGRIKLTKIIHGQIIAALDEKSQWDLLAAQSIAKFVQNNYRRRVHKKPIGGYLIEPKMMKAIRKGKK